MPVTHRASLLVGLFVVGAVAAGAQGRGGLMADLSKDVTEVEGKVIALANAIPESAYDWRPGPGVRSVGEVFIHVAAYCGEASDRGECTGIHHEKLSVGSGHGVRPCPLGQSKG